MSLWWARTTGYPTNKCFYDYDIWTIFLHIYLCVASVSVRAPCTNFGKTKSLAKQATDTVLWQFWNRKTACSSMGVWKSRDFIDEAFIMFYFLLYVNRQNCSCLQTMCQPLKAPLIPNVAAVYSCNSFFNRLLIGKPDNHRFKHLMYSQTNQYWRPLKLLSSWHYLIVEGASEWSER